MRVVVSAIAVPQDSHQLPLIVPGSQLNIKIEVQNQRWDLRATDGVILSMCQDTDEISNVTLKRLADFGSVLWRQLNCKELAKQFVEQQHLRNTRR